jgi:hypothetical protein
VALPRRRVRRRSIIEARVDAPRLEHGEHALRQVADVGRDPAVLEAEPVRPRVDVVLRLPAPEAPADARLARPARLVRGELRLEQQPQPRPLRLVVLAVRLRARRLAGLEAPLADERGRDAGDVRGLLEELGHVADGLEDGVMGQVAELAEGVVLMGIERERRRDVGGWRIVGPVSWAPEGVVDRRVPLRVGGLNDGAPVRVERLEVGHGKRRRQPGLVQELDACMSSVRMHGSSLRRADL